MELLRTIPNITHHSPIPTSYLLNESANPPKAKNSIHPLHLDLNFIPPQSLTAILPVSPNTRISLAALLEPFLHPLAATREIIILCPHSATTDIRRELRNNIASLDALDHLDISLQPWHPSVDVFIAQLQAALAVTTEWVLLLDERGINGFTQVLQMALVRPPNATMLWGVEGVPFDEPSAFSTPLGLVRPALSLRTPFVAHRSLLLKNEELLRSSRGWEALGSLLGTEQSTGLILTEAVQPLLNTTTASNDPMRKQLDFTELNFDMILQEPAMMTTTPETLPSVLDPLDLLIILPTITSVGNASRLLCALSSNSPYRFKTLVTGLSQTGVPSHPFAQDSCRLEYDVLPTVHGPSKTSCPVCDALLSWRNETQTSVVVMVKDIDPLLAAFVASPAFGEATVIQIPLQDLTYADWMTTLTLTELRNWHTPRIELSIVTKDRPHSLSRLLHSLSLSRFFGDSISLRINIEQDCDKDTLLVCKDFKWLHGSVHLQHRVIHGGLLPAVVEAWYPQTDDDYGLILEDDVEVSPLFYAWVKMTVLRYRYGLESGKNPHMFGISLYQQKNLELRLEGRRSFAPRALFLETGVPHPATPYLSQVPCSWGAVYFPEHWREFHDYLSLRLAESIAAIGDEIVPNVRSNHWARSWKRFFIELAYLRGYMMLYPNFDDYISLSTNHLEVGSHVKVRSQEKKELFLLPLMTLPIGNDSTLLLDLPRKTLPPMDELPVLNLTGYMVTSQDILRQGRRRREALFSNPQSGCNDLPLYDVDSLVCRHIIPSQASNLSNFSMDL